MTKQRDCRVCGGAGWTETSAEMHAESHMTSGYDSTCVACGGTGKEMMHTKLEVPPSAGDASRFGTVLHSENGWTVVVPFNDEMARRAIRVGAIEVEEAK